MTDPSAKWGNIPPELKALDRWVCFRVEPDPKRPGKDRKLPISARTGEAASSTDPRTWDTFDHTSWWAKERGLQIGFALGKDCGIVAIDLDGVVDETGSPALDAWNIVFAVGSYWEVSQSGTGLHGYAFGDLPPGGRKRGGFEVYDSGRMVIVTGDVLPGWETLADATDAIARVHAEAFPAEERPGPQPDRPETPAPDDVAERIERARRAKNGEKFRALYDRGDAGAYDGDESAADQALCNHLCFWLGPHAALIDQAFRASALMRPKWNRAARQGERYGEGTVRRALELVREHYAPVEMPELPREHELEWELAAVRLRLREEREARGECERTHRNVMAILGRDDLTHAERINMVMIAKRMAVLDRTEVNDEGISHRQPMAWFAGDAKSCTGATRRTVERLEHGLGRWVGSDGEAVPAGEGEFQPVPLLKRTTETEWMEVPAKKGGGEKKRQPVEVSYFERAPAAGATMADTLEAINGLVTKEPRKHGGNRRSAQPGDTVRRTSETWRYWKIEHVESGDLIDQGKHMVGKPKVDFGTALADGTVDWGIVRPAPSEGTLFQVENGSPKPNGNGHADEDALGLPPLLFSGEPDTGDCVKCGHPALPGSVYCRRHETHEQNGRANGKAIPATAEDAAAAQGRETGRRGGARGPG